MLCTYFKPCRLHLCCFHAESTMFRMSGNRFAGEERHSVTVRRGTAVSNPTVNLMYTNEKHSCPFWLPVCRHVFHLTTPPVADTTHTHMNNVTFTSDSILSLSFSKCILDVMESSLQLLKADQCKFTEWRQASKVVAGSEGSHPPARE